MRCSSATCCTTSATSTACSPRRGACSRPGGRLTLLEPNRASPFILLQAALIPAERGVLRSTAAALEAMLARAGFRVTGRSHDQPFPIERVLLHPSFGLPSLGAQPLVARALAAADALARRLLPERAWMYLVFEATVPTVQP